MYNSSSSLISHDVRMLNSNSCTGTTNILTSCELTKASPVFLGLTYFKSRTET